MMLWAALGNASRYELVDAVHKTIAETPGGLNIREDYPSSRGEIVWPDHSGKDNKISFEFNFGNATVEQRIFYFTAVYFAGQDSGSASAIDVNARARLQNLLDDVRKRLGRDALKSANGVVIK